MQDLQPVKKPVDGLVEIPLNEYQRPPLYSFSYNVSTSAFSKPPLLKRFNSRDQTCACEEMRRWAYAGGMKWKGLQNRRDMERALPGRWTK